MGKLSNEPYIHHFSHPHPLELTTQPLGHQLTVTLCSCCSLRCDNGAFMYACRTCAYGGTGGFALHVACAQMPALITHPSHPKHPLSLHPAPPYSGEGPSSFNCDACGGSGSAFCYHCPECDFDLHPTCASKPLSAAHPRHHHQLGLEFFPPYHVRAFSCDVCGGTGKNHWLYRCALCEFDAHLECATTPGGAPNVGQAPSLAPQKQHTLQHYPSYPGTYNNNNIIQPQPQAQHHNQHHLQHQASAPGTLQNHHYQATQPMTPSQRYNYTPPASGSMMAPHPQQQNMYQQQGAGGPGGQQGNNNSLGSMMAQSFIDAAAQQAGQTVVQNIMGGGGGNGGSGNDDAGGGGGGGNGGGGNDDAGGGGGGGGDDSSGSSSVFSNVLGSVFGGGGGDSD